MGDNTCIAKCHKTITYFVFQLRYTCINTWRNSPGTHKRFLLNIQCQLSHSKHKVGFLLASWRIGTSIAISRIVSRETVLPPIGTGHTKRRATIGRPRGNGRPHSPHSQRCHRYGTLHVYVRCSSWRLIVAVLRCSCDVEMSFINTIRVISKFNYNTTS